MAVGAAVVGVVWRWIAPGMARTTQIVYYAGFYGVVPHGSFRFYAAAMGAGAVALPLAAWLSPRLSLHIWWLLLTAYTAAVTLPGLFQPIVLAHAGPEALQAVEWHFDSVLGGTYTLAAGSMDRHIGYTYLLSLAKALVERNVGPLSFAGDIRLVQWMNVAFALGVLAACYLWDRARPLIALVTLALVLPWVHNTHFNIFFPNQSGLRFIFFPLAIVMFRCAHRLSAQHAAVAWGSFAALAILWNLETGVAVTAGVVVHLAMRCERLSPGDVLPSAARFLLGLAAVCVAVGLVGGLGLGLWPLGFGLPRRLIERTATGYGYGYQLYLDPVAVLLFGYAVWAVLALAAARRAGTMDARAMDRGAIGVVTLVWAAYYVLQPHPWNVWSYLPLGGILLADNLFPESTQPSACAGFCPVLRISFVLAVTIAVPAAALGGWQTWQSLDRGSNLASVAALDSERIARRVSGVMITAGEADRIESRAAFLAGVPADTVVVTGNSYLLPKLTGRVELFPARDPGYSATTRPQFDSLVAKIRGRSPSMLLFDDPATLATDGVHRRYFERLQAELADRYGLERVTSGWSIWTRR